MMMFLKRFGNRLFCALERLSIFKTIMQHKGLAHVMVAFIDQHFPCLPQEEKEQKLETACKSILKIIDKPLALNDDAKGRPVMAGFSDF